MAADDLPLEWSLTEEDELYFMANLHPQETGLTRTIWVSPKGDARHDVRVKVSAVPGGRMQLSGAPVVSVRPQPRLLHGELASAELEAVIAWIALNEDVIVDYWEDQATTSDLVRRLKRLPD